MIIVAALRLSDYKVVNRIYKGSVSIRNKNSDNIAIVSNIDFVIAIYATFWFSFDFKIVSSNFKNLKFTYKKIDDKLIKVFDENCDEIFYIERIETSTFCSDSNIKLQK